MKTFFVKVLSAFSLVAMLSSCLGGGDAYTEVTEDFAYIKYDDVNGKYALAYQAGPIKSDNIDLLEAGRAYYVNYKVMYKSGSVFAEAERFELAQRDPIPQAAYRMGEPYDGISPQLLPDSINPSSLSVAMASPFESDFEDNWLLRASVPKSEDDKVGMYFYYDRNGQEENGKALEKNQIIIDVRFVRTQKSGNVDENRNEVIEAIGSLNDIRRVYTPTFEEAGFADVLLKFRYMRKSDKGVVTDYLGSFYTTSSSSQALYYMRFLKEE